MQFQTQLTINNVRSQDRSFNGSSSRSRPSAPTRNLSVVVDKRIVIYGGQDITKALKRFSLGRSSIARRGATAPLLPKSDSSDQNRSDGSQRSSPPTRGDEPVPKPRSDRSMRRDWRKRRPDRTSQQFSRSTTSLISDRQDQLLQAARGPDEGWQRAVRCRAARIDLVVDREDIVYGGRHHYGCPERVAK